MCACVHVCAGIHDCFLCGVPGREGTDVFRCMRMCGKAYHLSCLAANPRTKWLPGQPLAFVQSGVSRAAQPAAAAPAAASSASASASPAAHHHHDHRDARDPRPSIVDSVAMAVGAMLVAYTAGDGSSSSASTDGGDGAAASSGSTSGGPSITGTDAEAVIGSLAARGIPLSPAACQWLRGLVPAAPIRPPGDGAVALEGAPQQRPAGTSTRFVCPFHTCVTCNQPFHAFHPPVFFRCHACPSAFHAPCVPASCIR